MPGTPWLPLAVSLLAGCAAPATPAWLPASLPSAPVEESYSTEPGLAPAQRKSLKDPGTTLFRASAWAWAPSFSGDGTYRGHSADGVDTDGTGGGASLSFRHRVVTPRKGESAEYPSTTDATEWPVFAGAILETLGGKASGNGGSGRLGATDLLFTFGAAHFSYGRDRPDFLVEGLVGVRRVTLGLEGPALAAANAEEHLVDAGPLLGVNVEIPLVEWFTVLARIDGSIGGSPESDSNATRHGLLGLRASLGDHLSVEGGWRWYKISSVRRESVTKLFFIFPVTDHVKYQDAALTASGPWLGLVYDF